MNGSKNIPCANLTALWLGGLLCLVVTTLALGETAADYRVILERNPFGLKPPPPPPALPVATTEPVKPTNWKLSGITALFKPPRAMFVNQMPGKPTPEYLSVRQGERQGAIEVLDNGIDLTNGTVRVKINGEERTMSFKEDGLKGPAGPPVGGGSPMPAMPLGMPPPGAPPGSPSIPMPPSAYPAPRTSAQPVGMSPTSVVPQVGIPNLQRPMRVTPGVAGQNATSPPPAPNVDPAEQVLRMEINRKLTEVQVQRGELPPLPGTELTPLTQPPPVPGR